MSPSRLMKRLNLLFAEGRDRGMTTAEYAVGIFAACSFALVLLAVVRSGPVRTALASIIKSALGLAG